MTSLLKAAGLSVAVTVGKGINVCDRRCSVLFFEAAFYIVFKSHGSGCIPCSGLCLLMFSVPSPRKHVGYSERCYAGETVDGLFWDLLANNDLFGGDEW